MRCIRNAVKYQKDSEIGDILNLAMYLSKKSYGTGKKSAIKEAGGFRSCVITQQSTKINQLE